MLHLSSRIGLIAFLSAFLSSSALAKKIIVVSLSDTHIFTEGSKADGVSIARAAQRIEEIRRANPGVPFFFVHAGDFISPSESSRIFEGKDIVEILNRMRPDAATIGNHEFDYGMSVLKKRLDEATFPIVVANVFEGAEKKRLNNLAPYVVVEKGGLRVAFVGAATVETSLASARKMGDDVSITDPASAVRNSIADLKKRPNPPDMIVGLTHLEFDEDQRLAEMNPELSVIIGGHEHIVRDDVVNGIPILKVRNDIQDLRVLEFEVPTAQGLKVVRPTTNRIEPITRKIRKDPSIAKLMRSHESEVTKKLSEVVGYFPKELDGTWDHITKALEKGQSEYSNFIGDIVAKELGVDFSYFNLGCISRSNQIYPAGPVTFDTLNRIYPYSDPYLIIKIKGRDIKEYLEKKIGEGFEKASRFPILGGARATWEAKAIRGSRIREFTVAGKPLESDKEYSVSINQYEFLSDAILPKVSKLLTPIGSGKSEIQTLVSAVKAQFPIAGKGCALAAIAEDRQRSASQ